MIKRGGGHHIVWQQAASWIAASPGTQCGEGTRSESGAEDCRRQEWLKAAAMLARSGRHRRLVDGGTDSNVLVPLLCCCFSKPCAVAASRRKMRRVCSVHDSMARSLAQQWAAWLSGWVWPSYLCIAMAGGLIPAGWGSGQAHHRNFGHVLRL